MDTLIRISIADDHHLIISSIENMLNNAGNFEICGTYNTGEALMEGLSVTNPEVVILDYHLPDQNGSQIARQITYHYPSIRILALTGYDKPGLSAEMLGSGCSGYLLKSSAKQDSLLKAIHAVFDGNLYLDKALKEKFAENVQKEHHQEEQPKLTKRELEILACIVEEMSSQEIADKLFISKKTVDNHRASILMKTGTKTPWGLMKLALELKLV